VRTNTISARFGGFTHEGASARVVTDIQALRRSVMSCMLFEGEFYEDGQTIAKRIEDLAAKVRPIDLAVLAIDARHTSNLRHVPLLLLKSLAARAKDSDKIDVASVVERVISRADELAEFVAIYWKDGKRPLSAQIKKGLALAFHKFDEYALAKYDRDGAVRLRDVLRLCHPKPDSPEQAELWKRLLAGELKTPDTWEVQLSAGKDKKETFERLIRERKLGYLALLRNLRNMVDAGCDPKLVEEAIVARKSGAERVLPFRFVAAARAAPRLEGAIDTALCEGIASAPKLKGRTVVLVDVSGSMDVKLSGKSDMTRADAAAALASVVNAESLRVFTFSNSLVEVPARRGMAGIDAIKVSQSHDGTNLGGAVELLNHGVVYDRLIVVTDEQSHDRVSGPRGKGYMINVASAKNGVGYGPWVHIDGFSESTLRWIVETEN
jgi:60 kDa SS-A/Ro ribonucleoprotein